MVHISRKKSVRQALIVAAFALFVTAFGFRPAGAQETTETRLLKAYAGKTSFDVIRLHQNGFDQTPGGTATYELALENVNNDVKVPDRSQVPCESGYQFGVVFLVGPRHLNFVSFRSKWTYTPAASPSPVSQDEHEHVVRKLPTENHLPQALVRLLRSEEQVPGEFRLELRDNGVVLLEHVFEVVNCRDAE